MLGANSRWPFRLDKPGRPGIIGPKGHRRNRSICAEVQEGSKVRRLFPKRLAFERVEPKAVEYYGPGQQPSNPPEPGDFILLHSKEIFARLIQIGQRLRFHGRNGQYCHWNHAALIVGDNGDIVEALGPKIRKGNLSKYEGREYQLVRIIADAQDRQEAARFALWCLPQRYGYLTIASIAVTLVTG